MDVMRLSERLKNELRHSWLSSGRRESVAEHTWQMALLGLLVAEHLEHPVDLSKTLKMILVHDIAEIEVGDIPSFEKSERKNLKEKMEREAIERLSAQIPGDVGEEIKQLWFDYEESRSPEAKFAKALDKIEVQIQHNFADLKTWEEIEYDLVYTKMDNYCAHDSFLVSLCAEVKTQAEEEMIKFGRDPAMVKKKLGITS